jgi:hypothetical protein
MITKKPAKRAANDQPTAWQAIESKTIREAIAGLESLADPSDLGKVKRLVDVLTDVVPVDGSFRTFHVALAALLFARKAMLIHSESMAELHAETQTRVLEQLSKLLYPQTPHAGIG